MQETSHYTNPTVPQSERKKIKIALEHIPDNIKKQEYL